MPIDTFPWLARATEEREGLKKQKSVFTSSRDISAAALMASYLIANDIALASKPCCEGEFVKTCILKAAEIVCSEKLKFLLILARRETLWQGGFRTFPRL